DLLPAHSSLNGKDVLDFLSVLYPIFGNFTIESLDINRKRPSRASRLTVGPVPVGE
ncbi:577_t:CDS:2, partial [Scutellospora calospora]